MRRLCLSSNVAPVWRAARRMKSDKQSQDAPRLAMRQDLEESEHEKENKAHGRQQRVGREGPGVGV